MQRCNLCGSEIRYIAIDALKSIVCDAEKLDFVTENGRRTKGYLIHSCKKLEAEDDRNESSDNARN